MCGQMTGGWLFPPGLRKSALAAGIWMGRAVEIEMLREGGLGRRREGGGLYDSLIIACGACVAVES